MISSDVASRKPSNPAGAPIWVSRLPGLQPYVPMWDRQQQLAAARAAGEIGDLLLLLEHEHVYTNGWQGRREHLLADDRTLAQIGATYYEIERGGDITYHGPGQLVGYSILHLREAGLGVREYVGRLEQVVIRTLAAFDVEGHTRPGIVGVWVRDEKIGAIGVKVRRGVSYHGFALNVDPDLDHFSHIVPCGLRGAGVTSLSACLRRRLSVDDVVPACAGAFAAVFGREICWGRSEPGVSP